MKKITIGKKQKGKFCSSDLLQILWTKTHTINLIAMQELRDFQNGLFPVPNAGALKHKYKKKVSKLYASEKLGHQWKFNYALVLKLFAKNIHLG